MKVDLDLHAALRGPRPRFAALRGGARFAALRDAVPPLAALGSIARRLAAPGSLAPRLAAPGRTGPRFGPVAAARIGRAVPRVDPRAAAARWWRDRSPSERWLIVVFIALAVAAGVARLVWAPLIAVRATAQAEIARDDRIAAELRVAGPELARIAAARRGSLATVVTAAAARAGLTVARLEPQGADVAVGLDGVGFDALVAWLAALDHDAGIVVVDLKVERRPDPGLVTAQVTLAER